MTKATQAVNSRKPQLSEYSSKSRSTRWLAVCAAAWCFCLLAGCQSLRKESTAIPATDLPLQYRAESRTNKPAIDLSALARRSINSDLIYPGDVLDVTLFTGAEKETPEPLPYRVTPQGMLELPLVGEIKVAGLSLTDAEESIRSESINRRVYRSPIVSVLMNTRQSDRVLVVGAVNEPKVYELPRAGSDLLAAITEAGGLTEDAGTIIEIRHPATSTKDGVSQASFASDLLGESGTLPSNKTLEATSETSNSVHVDLVEAMAGKAGDLSLHDGSVVWVKEHHPETIYVQGLVKEAGEFDLPKDRPLRVHQAIALAKGRTIEFADKIHITRFLEAEQEPIVIEVSWKEAKSNRDANIVLMPGDVISVEETTQTFAADFLRNFFRVGFTSSIPGF